jgi:hypothetical protein
MPTFLHVGCARLDKAYTTPEFAKPAWREIRLDIDPAVQPDIVASMTDMSAVADGSVDALYSSHNIEHLYPTEVAGALAEFVRVLNPEGFAVIACPDLQSVAELVAQEKLMEPAYQSTMGPISPIDILYGHRASMAEGNLFMAHRTGFTQTSLSEVLREAGFGGVLVRRRARHFELLAAATVGPFSEGRLRGLARDHFPGRNPAT